MFISNSLSLLVTTVIILSFIVNGNSIKDRSDYAYATTTASLQSGFNFAAVGDWGCRSATTDTVNNIVDKKPELVLGLGDYSYENSERCWFKIIQPIDSIMKVSMGNHDRGPKLIELMKHFGLTSEYYSFDYQNVHFIALATESGYLDMSTDKAKEQLAFVKSDLEKASTNPNIDWIIPFFHRIMYARESAGVVDTYDHNLEDIYHSLFEQYGIKLVLQSHSHTYERTYPLKINVEDSDDPIITSKDLTNYYYNTDGLVIATIGTGGATPTVFSTNSEYSAVMYRHFYGFLNVDVSSDGTTLVGTFYKNDKNGGGEIKDQFTITKSAEGDLSLPPPPLPPLDVPIEEEESDGLEDGNDDVVEDANEPDDRSEGPDDIATESEGNIEDEEEQVGTADEEKDALSDESEDDG
jgi:hypothetical protein